MAKRIKRTKKTRSIFSDAENAFFDEGEKKHLAAVADAMRKFGKTEEGTIWLDPARTSVYAFYQFWINTADADVYKFLKYFTFLDVSEIDAIEEADKSAVGRPEAQGILAREVTRLVHGEEGLQAAQRISEALFSGDISKLTEDDFGQLKQDGLPSSIIGAENDAEGAAQTLSLVELLVQSGLAPSNKMAREFISNGAVLVNGEKVTDPASTLDLEKALFGAYFLLKRGKKLFHLAYSK